MVLYEMAMKEIQEYTSKKNSFENIGIKRMCDEFEQFSDECNGSDKNVHFDPSTRLLEISACFNYMELNDEEPVLSVMRNHCSVSFSILPDIRFKASISFPIKITEDSVNE